MGIAPQELHSFLQSEEKVKGLTMSTWASVFQITSLFEEEALMKIYVLLAARMLVSDETICFASGSVHFSALSPVVLARVDVFRGAGQRVDCFHNIFTCDCGWES